MIGKETMCNLLRDESISLTKFYNSIEKISIEVDNGWSLGDIFLFLEFSFDMLIGLVNWMISMRIWVHLRNHLISLWQFRVIIIFLLVVDVLLFDLFFCFNFIWIFLGEVKLFNFWERFYLGLWLEMG